MTRTPEQVAADNALTAAIERVTEHVDDDTDGWVMTEYVVVAAQHRFDDDGSTVTGLVILSRDGDVAPHRSLGLLDYAATRIRRTVTDD